jgi:hypothetical protein
MLVALMAAAENVHTLEFVLIAHGKLSGLSKGKSKTSAFLLFTFYFLRFTFYVLRFTF